MGAGGTHSVQTAPEPQTSVFDTHVHAFLILSLHFSFSAAK